MRYEARVTAFDVLDKVHVSVAIYRDDPDTLGTSLLVGTTVSVAPGTGESEPYQWARDALVQALESL